MTPQTHADADFRRLPPAMPGKPNPSGRGHRQEGSARPVAVDSEGRSTPSVARRLPIGPESTRPGPGLLPRCCPPPRPGPRAGQFVREIGPRLTAQSTPLCPYHTSKAKKLLTLHARRDKISPGSHGPPWEPVFPRSAAWGNVLGTTSTESRITSPLCSAHDAERRNTSFPRRTVGTREMGAEGEDAIATGELSLISAATSYEGF